ncbi:MAG TPA: glycosyltransferase family 1 protein [Desulfuromonas sp.]|nr:glycosyltransferase family 1 protein [Desulfuromonas sp.]HBT83964.1 glycosyltransferase family 1 protein [Desulfuromonas sp.]
MLIGSLAESLIGFRGRLLEDMAQMGHEVVACAPNGSTALRNDLLRLGVRFQGLPLNRTGLNPLQDLYSLWSLTRLFQRQRPDVVLSYTIKPIIYGSLGATLARVGTISSMITGRGSSFSTATPWQRLTCQLAKSLYRLGLRSNRVVFFQNPDDLRLFIDYGIVTTSNHPTLINGSGVDLDYYVPAPLPANASFLLIARLLRAKGICYYAEAARQLKSRYPQAKFYLVGGLEKSSRGVPVAEIDHWVSQGWIDYLGTIGDVRPAIAAASVYVLPSHYGEGIPRSILEAMAMGRPIVTTDTPGCRETVQPGKNGYLVPVHDPVQLAASMERFIHDPASVATMGNASRRLAEAKFDVREVNRSILQSLGLLHETTV